MKPTGVKLTWDDYVLFPEDGMRHELIDGEHYVTPAPFLRHQEIVGRLHLAIGNYLAAHPIGRVFVAPLDVISGNSSYRSVTRPVHHNGLRPTARS